LQPGRANAGELRRVLVVLCLTEITSWGVLYYAFPVLAARITQDTGWSVAATTTAFSLALVVSAGIGVPVGRRLDAAGPRLLMTAGSVLGVLAVLVVASAQSLWWFFAGWVLGGAAMAGTLYTPAFAALTRWYGEARVSALTTLTLVAGLASTVFAPLTAAAMEHLTWRQTYVVLAVVLAVVTIPAHAFGLTPAWPPAWPVAIAPEPGDVLPAPVDPAAVARSRTFVVLTLALTLAAFGIYAVVVNLVPLLLERGLSASTAALALGLGGAGQVAGRLGYARLAARTGARTRMVAVLLSAAVTTAVLALVPGPAPLLVAGSVAAGCARGIFTLVQATTVSERWGVAHYGRLNGLLSAPLTIAAAVAPAAGAALADLLGGYPPMFLVLAVLSLIATAPASAVTPPRGPA
jgi:MFS family permease